MKFTSREIAIHQFTLALTFNAKEVRTLLPVAEALLVYKHTQELLLKDTRLLLNQYKSVHLEDAQNGSIITVFKF